MREGLYNQSILITGGTGSFGRAMVRHLLEGGLPRKVIIFSRDEWKQWEMQNGDPLFRHPKLRYFIGDVRDYNRLRRAFLDVDYVIHAAALKQVPAAEYNPTEFVKTNIEGAVNVIEAALDTHVKSVVALSTDKAVNPVNLYGATKLCSDRLFTAARSYVGKRSEPHFCVVRYGNVINSRGSLLPYWQQLLAQGVKSLPLTDVRMTRFWITLEEAVAFVLSALQRTVGGEIFVPKIPSMRIIDMAKALTPGCECSVIGIRPGEKIHEVLISSEEGTHTLQTPGYYLIMPEGDHPAGYRSLLYKMQEQPCCPVPEGFSYTSDGNKDWLLPEQFSSLF